MFLFKRRDTERAKTIERLYGAIVAQARRPAFYVDFGVPDTVEGRFDLLVLHVHLVGERLAAGGEDGIAFGRELLDYFFGDMDASLREIGIADLKVPKKMRTLAEAYFGRSTLYGEAIKAGDKAALAKALARNVLASDDAAAGQGLAAYALRAAEGLRLQAPHALFAAEVHFPEPVKAMAHV